jgi:ribosome-associated protein
MLDTRRICSFADYFVICSGDSDRQLEAIREEINKTLKQEGVIPHHSEGTADSGWVLIDIGEVIVHLFSPQQRDYYKLDELWSEAVPVIRIQ